MNLGIRCRPKYLTGEGFNIGFTGFSEGPWLFRSGEEPDVTRNAQALECDVRLWAAAPPRFEDAMLVRDHIIHVSTKGVQGDMAWSSRDIHPFRSGRMQW